MSKEVEELLVRCSELIMGIQGQLEPPPSYETHNGKEIAIVNFSNELSRCITQALALQKQPPAGNKTKWKIYIEYLELDQKAYWIERADVRVMQIDKQEYEILKEMFDQQAAEIKRLEKALEYYAADKNYQTDGVVGNYEANGMHDVFIEDRGRRAKQALK